MGVSHEGNRYRVRVSVNGKRKNLGQYKTKKEAQARLKEYNAKLDEEEKFHHAFKDIVDMTPLFDPEEYPRLDIEKPSLWDKLKSVWQRKQRNS